MTFKEIKVPDQYFDDIEKFHKFLLKKTYPKFPITNIYVSSKDIKRLKQSIYKLAKKENPNLNCTCLKKKVIPWYELDMLPSDLLSKSIKPGYVIVIFDELSI
jgi:hypothetical protein